MSVTPSGMSMLVKARPLKALLPIMSTEAGITVLLLPQMSLDVAFSMMALQLLRES